jgi:multisubunit Na+/H+ antiporter MnhE subunit
MRVPPVVCFAALAALWAASTNLTVVEVVAGASASILAAAAFVLACRALSLKSAVRMNGARCASHLAAPIVVETLAVLARIFTGRADSRLQQYHFRRGDMRRTELWVVLFGTFTPDSIVVDFNPGRRCALVHQMKFRRAPAALRCLGGE